MCALVTGVQTCALPILRQGRRREQLVEAFFAAWPDPDFGEEIAQAFRVRYQALKAAGLSADEIFGELQTFAGGMTGEPARQGAVLAVLSYFFRSEEHTSELQSLMRISYAVFCLNKKNH